MALTPGIFLDKACTIQDDVPFCVGPRRIALPTGMKHALQRLRTLDVPLVVIGNQPGMAVGQSAREELNAVQKELEKSFVESGVELAGLYCCPHHPEAIRQEYSIRRECPMPKLDLILMAARDLEIDIKRSWFVGELLDDIEAGQRAGCTTVLIVNGSETEWTMNRSERVPHFQVPDMAAFCELVISEMTAIKVAENATKKAAQSAARENTIRATQPHAVIQMLGQQLELLTMESTS